MQTRRQFLKNVALTPLALSGGSLLSTLVGMNAQAADPSGYRALVCVFLFGGMDCHDTVLPYDQSSYDSYASIRASLLSKYAARPEGSTRIQSALLPLEASLQSGSRKFALPPEMSALHNLYSKGQAAIVGNVGPLIVPIDRLAFESNLAEMPARLFSHNDQFSTWMSFGPEGTQLGWGGRFGDKLNRANANANPVFSQISVGGNSVFLSGETVSTYQINTDGVQQITLLADPGSGLPSSIEGFLNDHFNAAGDIRSNLFEKDVVNLSRESLEANRILDAALDGAPPLITEFPESFLGAQLGAVARTISVRGTLGASRQVFFVIAGGFDTHSNQVNTLPALQQDISDSIAAFYASTEELGVSSDVTTFTASDFGRTLTVNGDGTDHGWGGHHFVVGGGVKGGEIYGEIPVSELGHDQDSGNGRLIPSVSIEQFAAPMGTWFGLTPTELNDALPALANFPEGPVGLFDI